MFEASKKQIQVYTPGSTNIAGWKMDPIKMYFLLKMWIFQPALLGHTRGYLEEHPIFLNAIIFSLKIFSANGLGPGGLLDS